VNVTVHKGEKNYEREMEAVTELCKNKIKCRKWGREKFDLQGQIVDAVYYIEAAPSADIMHEYVMPENIGYWAEYSGDTRFRLDHRQTMAHLMQEILRTPLRK
jgi:hypothetical protein